MKVLMAIDAGTGSVRSVVFGTDGVQLAVSSREWMHKEDARYPGSMDFDCRTNWSLTLDTISDAIERAGVAATDVLAVATTSMREAIVLFDDNLNELWACANVDARATAEVGELMAISKSLESGVYGISGQTFSLSAHARLLWVKKNMPDIYRKTKYVAMLNDWLSAKLSGKISSEPSNACTSGVFSLKNRSWDAGIAEMCGLRTDIFPPVYECGDVIGNISEKCAGESGLSTSTLVVAGGGDAQMGALGAGVVGHGQAAVFGGSFWQLESNTEKLLLDEKCRIRVNCHAVPGMWQYEAIAFFPGLVMRWFRDAFCQLEQRIEQETGEEIYAQMDRMAEKCPPAAMLSAFSNVMDYISWRHAAPTFTGFSIDPLKHNRYSFYRSIMENAALVTKAHMLLVHELTGNLPDEIIFAGGASKSPLWCQILADVLEVNIKVPAVKESTALGAAICAGVGAGVYINMQDACGRVVKWDRVFTPNSENRSAYNKLYADFLAVYDVQLKLADSGVTKHMWKAPGIEN